ncbi:MAG: YeeE/YedE family protein [Proteobacteria bacterium]|nr:YeeE/YedE family protein [Pseudomonadota bacterium]
MSDEKENSVLSQVIKDGYANLFYEQWSVKTAALLLALLSVIAFAWARPWGVVGGLRNWGDWVFYGVGLFDRKPVSPITSSNSILTFGILLGAFISALMAKQFAFNRIPKLELIKAVVGGILMGISSAMAGGCNIGGFFEASASLSLAGPLMLIALLIGANLAIRYLYWEMENIPAGALPPKKPKAEGAFDWKNIQPALGALLIIGALAAAYYYATISLTQVGGLLLIAAGIGLVFQRSRLCFVAGFRDPFMTGETDKTKAVILCLIATTIGYAVLKWTGLRGEGVYITNTVWFGSLVGGLIFGFGMVIAGGCGSGCLFRVGEGNVKLIVVMIFFALFNSLFKAFIRANEGFENFIGRGVFLPDYINYLASIGFIIVILLAWYLFVSWNEETEKFVIEL